MASAGKKAKSVFRCAECDTEHNKWIGQCSGCGEWNTLVEHITVAPSRNTPAGTGNKQVTTLDQVARKSIPRLSTGLTEFDRVLGGGLVPGSTLVLGGFPGAGKSTLLLQSACQIAQSRVVLYVAGEESLEQIADRAHRLQLQTDKLKVLAETDITVITSIMEQERPAVVIVDSIQVMHHPDIDSLAGNTTQVRECANVLSRFAKRLNSTVIMVGHITKSENLAGPMTLNHLVDATLMLSSTDDARYRIVRSDKNRFGSVAEIGVFAMTGVGMKEVRNPSAIFLSKSNKELPGSIVTVLWEGSRPLLVELQALVDQSALGNPRRVTVGIDNTRVAMLLAVLNRHGGVAVHDQDVYVNVVGGIRVSEPSADLAILLCVLSSLRDRAIPADVFAFGEIGLSGEVRPCANGQERIREAAKHGFKTAIVPAANAPKKPIAGLELVPVNTLQEALDWAMASLSTPRLPVHS
jgi:DNA repair protein RadA/Sms